MNEAATAVDRHGEDNPAGVLDLAGRVVEALRTLGVPR